ncbi:MAG: L,D-transpeptidase, partial [bacterium]|nr:L,D-transpeptidase [bacterium]
MKKIITITASIYLLLISSITFSFTRFGETLCNSTDYFCMKVKKEDTWDRLFPNVEERDIVKRINRMNINLTQGMTIAVPKSIERLTIYDVSPFPRYIESDGEKTIYVSQKKLAWGAYDSDGELLWWGPISSGIGKCNVTGGCSTPTGSFRI